jgi:Flp pilus assembly protein TadB
MAAGAGTAFRREQSGGDVSRRAQENLILGVIILVLVAVLAASAGYGPRARMVPVPVAVFALILALVQLVWQNLRSTDELQVDLLAVLTRRGQKESAVPGVTDTMDQAGHSNARIRQRRVAIACGIVVLFLALVLLVGPIAAIFVFTAGYFLLSGHYSWFKALLYTAMFTAGIYLLFVVALDIQLYHGVLEPLVERLR